MHNTRFWKARRSSVPAESVTAGPHGSSSDHAINAPSVRGYSGPYVFRIRIPIDQRSAVRTFWQTSFHCCHTSSASQVTRPRGAGLGEATYQDLRSRPLLGCRARRATTGPDRLGGGPWTFLYHLPELVERAQIIRPWPVSESLR